MTRIWFTNRTHIDVTEDYQTLRGLLDQGAFVEVHLVGRGNPTLYNIALIYSAEDVQRDEPVDE